MTDESLIPPMTTSEASLVGAATTPKPNGGPSVPETAEPEPPKEAPPKPPPEKAPEPLTAKDVVVPEGFELVDDAIKESLVSILNEYKVPKEGLAKLVELQTGVMKAASERSSGLWQETQETWRKAVQSDPEYGGYRFKTNMGLVSRLIEENKAGPTSRPLREQFDLTGAGNNPEIVKKPINGARQYPAEGRPAQGQPARAGRTHAQILFPNQGKI